MKRQAKTLSKTELFDKVFKTDFIERIKNKYPYRDYEYQFELMCDWWSSERGILPKTLAAFNNWISRTQIDENIKRRHDNEENKEKWRRLQAEMEIQQCKDASKYLDKIKKDLLNKFSI
jgi:hypothetical protein